MRPATALLIILILIGGLELGYLSDCFSDYPVAAAGLPPDTRHVFVDRSGRTAQEGKEAAEGIGPDGAGVNQEGRFIHKGSPTPESRFNRPADYRLEATAYTHTGYRTASGVWPRVGIIATDPKVIPLGTRLYIDGYGFCTALDTGGAIRGNRVDIFLNTEKECRKYGRRHGVRVWVLKK